jgi:hypothetical protein
MTIDISQQAAVDQISKRKRRRTTATITQDYLKKTFYYDNGFLIRRENSGRWGHLPAGSIIGGVGARGYHETRVDGVTYVVHRLIWLYHYGYLPENDIDHINRNRADNRIENLREVSHQCNLRNIGIAINNTSGIKGVSYCQKRRQWRAYLKADQKNIFLGRFCDFFEAVAARLAAEQCLGWFECDMKSPAFIAMRGYLGGERK